MIAFIKDAANPVRKMQVCQICKEETGQAIFCVITLRDYCLPCWMRRGGVILNQHQMLTR